jgi:hypothetical protein
MERTHCAAEGAEAAPLRGGEPVIASRSQE